MPDLDPALLQAAQDGTPTKGLIPEFEVWRGDEWQGRHSCGNTIEAVVFTALDLAATGHRIGCTYQAASLPPRRSGVRR